MEEEIKELFFGDRALTPEEIQGMSPLNLAFIGDGVYELLVRSRLMKSGSKPGKLHRLSAEKVKATAQARAMDVLLDVLTEEEMAILRRGRNAKSLHTAKNAGIGAYRRATGVEALFGWLWLKGEGRRIKELFRRIEENL